MQQSAHIFEDMNYWLYRPAGDAPPPVMLFLHGSGERGTDADLVLKHGLPRLIHEGKDFPFLVVSPQCPSDVWWHDVADTVMALFDHALASETVDSKRIYLTGLSMGGGGTWYIGAHHPTLFAAAVPVCGTMPPGFPDAVCAMKDVPVWAFHGAKDETVPAQNSYVISEKLRECGGSARLSIYPEADHNVWDQVYDDPMVYDWLWAHSL